jgi:hypothetical protein
MISGFENAIILAGSGRSGTTWLGNIIAGDDIRILFEPFDERHVPELKGLGLRPYFDPGKEYSDWRPLIEKVLSGELKNPWIDQDAGRFNPERDSGRILIKEIRANGMLAWISRNYGCKIAYLLRHPCSVIASRIQLKWDTHVEEYLEQDDFIKEYCPGLEKISREAKTAAQRHALMWCLENIVPLRQLSEYHWITCKFEELAANPEWEAERILALLGLEFDEARKKAVHEPSRTSWGENPKRALGAWREQLSEKEKEEIGRILNFFGIETYNLLEEAPHE